MYKCATRGDTHNVRVSYTPRHQVTGRPQRHHLGNFSARNLRERCEGYVPCSPEGAREGSPNADLSFRLTFLSHKPERRWARRTTHGTHEPASSRRRTRMCDAEPSLPRRTGLTNTRAHQP